jgi:hypothetical protein
MDTKRPSLRLNLSQEQREIVRQATNRDADAIELSIEELEERIAPMKQGYPKPLL